jgi:hypothetical protein
LGSSASADAATGRYCGHCGLAMSAESRFCTGCGREHRGARPSALVAHGYEVLVVCGECVQPGEDCTRTSPEPSACDRCRRPIHGIAFSVRR